MGKINMGRVIPGGLLAGLVINIGEFILNDVLLGEDWRAAMQALNLREMAGSDIIWWVIFGFVLGIGAVYLYAAIRPRYQPGPKTAICAGLFVWFFIYLLGFGSSLIPGIWPTKIVVWSIVWGLFEIPIATVVGAWQYKEEVPATT